MKQTNTSLLAILATLVTSCVIYNLPLEFVSLPSYIKCFPDLTSMEYIDALRFAYKGTYFGLVYGIYNTFTHQIYVGSTQDPSTRFYSHLVSGVNSNVHLRNSIAKYGLANFCVIIFEVLAIGANFTPFHLFALEQKYLDYHPKRQKYNVNLIAGGGRLPMTEAEKLDTSKRMMGVNVGRAPINKGKKLTKAAKDVIWKASAHRRHIVYIYDDMLNLVGMYPSISQAVRVEHTQKNVFIDHMKNGTLWRGYYVTKVPKH